MTPISPPSQAELTLNGNKDSLVFPSEHHLSEESPIPSFASTMITAPNTTIDQQTSSEFADLGLDPLLGSFTDNFTTFMDNAPILRNPFSPSYQPLHALFPELSLGMSVIGGSYDPGVRLTEGLFCDSISSDSVLSPFGSRLPSLQPEEPPVQLQKEKSKNHLIVSAECCEHLMQELVAFSNVLPNNFILPSRHTLSRLIATYFNTYHKHYPFLHVPTLRLRCINVELFLAIAGIGARYCKEPEISTDLFHVAKAVVTERIRQRRGYTATEKYPQNGTSEGSSANTDRTVISGSHVGADTNNVDLIQTLLLLIAIATWFNREPNTYEALSIRSVLDTLIREEEMKSSKSLEPQNWSSWINSEVSKRTKMVAFCMFNIHTILFDLPPMMLSSELKLDLPCSERQWKAENESAWLKSLDSGNPSQGFQETFEQLFEEDQALESNALNGFSSLGGFILIHAIVQRIWLVRNTHFPSNRGRGFHPDEINKFERALKSWSWCWEHDQERSIDPLGPHGPLSFTSTTLLRLAYIRINMDLGPERSLNTWNPNLIAKSLDQSSGVQRSEKLTRAALHCAHALSIPVKLGIRLVAQTQVMYWSNQHALCSLECAVLLTKWLEAVTQPDLNPPLTAAEGRVLEFLAQLVAEANYKKTVEGILERKPLMSAALVRLWAALYTSDNAWEMVDLIGRSLTAYAKLLETRYS